MKEYIENNSNLTVEYPLDIDVDDIEIFSVVIPPFDELTGHVDKYTQPYNSWVWDKDAGHWKPPVQKPNLDLSMRLKWDESWTDWKVSFGSQNIDRKKRAFQLWLSAEADGSSMFLNACSTRDYMIKPFENITHGTRDIENLIKKYNDLVAENSDYVRPYMSIRSHIVVIDLSPIAIITYSECHDDAVDMFNELYSMHPQFFARTSQELFRLIIEWAYSHTHLNNQELTAVSCFNILKAVQMPKTIRDGLIAMQPQQVGKFLEGSDLALVEEDEDPESPAGFDRWINKLYQHYCHLKPGQESHIDILPDSYPM